MDVISADSHGVDVLLGGRPAVYTVRFRKRRRVYRVSVSPGGDGVHVASAGDDGVHVNSATHYGLHVGSAGNDGLWVENASGVGVWANTTQASGQWGFYTPDKIRGSNVTLESLSLVAQVSGPDGLTAGDLVTAAGVADPVSGSTVHVPLVRLARRRSDRCRRRCREPAGTRGAWRVRRNRMREKRKASRRRRNCAAPQALPSQATTWRSPSTAQRR